MYSLTFTVVDWVDVFTRKEHKLKIVESLRYCQENKGLEIYGWVLMSNHLHLIARAKGGFRLSDVIRDFKKFTAKSIIDGVKTEVESRREWMLYRFEYNGKFLNQISKYKIWKDDNHAILLDNKELMQGKLDYVHSNPVEALIVSEPEQYLFSSAINYSGGKGLIDCKLID